MESSIKAALVDLVISCIKGLKVFFVYIVPTTLIAIVTSSEFRELVATHPDLMMYSATINVVLSVIGGFKKRRTSEESGLYKIL